MVFYNRFWFGTSKCIGSFMETKKGNKMDSNQIREIINGQEPIAIMKYFEWPIFSNDYAKARYTLLRIDRKHNDIEEVDIPFNIVPFVISKLGCFEQVLRSSEGIVWERMGFRDIIKSSVPKAKIAQLIDLQ